MKFSWPPGRGKETVWEAGGSQYTVRASPGNRLILIQLRLETTAPGHANQSTKEIFLHKNMATCLLFRVAK